MALLVDVHAHMDYKDFESDLDKVITRAKDTGLKRIINCGLDIESNRKTILLSERYSIIQPSLGLYPTNAVALSDVEIKKELVFIEKKKFNLVALGEVGLDYFRSEGPEEKVKQKAVFQKFINLSKETGLPLIVHSRNAEEDVIEMLKSSKAKKVVLHCFSGKLSLIEEAAKLGYSFSVPPNILHSSHFQKLVEVVNINQILTETDSPFLGPRRGERNEPKNVALTVEKIAEIKKFTVKDVENNIFMNYQRMFG